MFKSIKEFFVGKPKVEEPAVQVPELVLTPEPIPVEAVKQEINPETVVISISDNMNMSFNTQSDTIIFTPPVDPNTWPFPKAVPLESEVKKKRTPVKRDKTTTKNKPAPAVTATKTKPRKKK
jgi:hypothetical protein